MAVTVHKHGDKCPRCGHWSGTGGTLTLRQGNAGTHLAGRLFLACTRPTPDDFCFHTYDHPYVVRDGKVVTLPAALIGQNGAF